MPFGVFAPKTLNYLAIAKEFLSGVLATLLHPLKQKKVAMDIIED
jgi:hypothetical protein